MKLTRRDFLRGAVVTAAGLAAGVKAGAAHAGGYVAETPIPDCGGYIVPESIATQFWKGEIGAVRMIRRTTTLAPTPARGGYFVPPDFARWLRDHPEELDDDTA